MRQEPGQAVQQAGVSHGNPPGSGLSYLEHICQLIEKIAQLQETNLRLQRQVCGLQKTGRVAKTRERTSRESGLLGSSSPLSGCAHCVVAKRGPEWTPPQWTSSAHSGVALLGDGRPAFDGSSGGGGAVGLTEREAPAGASGQEQGPDPEWSCGGLNMSEGTIFEGFQVLEFLLSSDRAADESLFRPLVVAAVVVGSVGTSGETEI
ncbi:hypothetical protein CRUP_032838 [Coryphaenoides rupestris]|nr:hypothetical protein CRUP_032838 [Coryphaenoides rupestris]